MNHLERIIVVLAVVMLAGTLVLGTTRPSAPPTPAASLQRTSPAPELASRPAQDADTASHTTSQPPLPLVSGWHPRPEEIVRLPWQIQDQVARTVLTPAPAFTEAEILTLPWQIQDQVRHVHQAPTTENRIPRR